MFPINPDARHGYGEHFCVRSDHAELVVREEVRRRAFGKGLDDDRFVSAVDKHASARRKVTSCSHRGPHDCKKRCPSR